MPTVIDEHTQFTDSNGLPIASGEIYIGTVNQDPVSNTITIYSDRELTTPITNPQPTDANGRSTNKIWVPGKHSIQVNDSADVQKYQSLDAGKDSDPVNGEWTPTLVCGTSGTITLGGLTDTLAYTKVGRVVTVVGTIITTAVSSPVGSLTMTGLPYAAANLTDSAGSTGFSFFGSSFATGTTRVCLGTIAEASTEVLLVEANGTDLAGEISNSTSLGFSFTYFTD